MLISLTKTTTSKLHKNFTKKSTYFTFTTLCLPLSTSTNSSTNPKNPFTINPKPLTKPQLETLIKSQFNNGKFTNLLQNVVASPSVLLTAAQNITVPARELTVESVSTWFELVQLAHQLAGNEFDPFSCCVTLEPYQNGNFRSGYKLVLPDLKLKVVIEALRLVLDVIYDRRFAAFCHGGRDGLGRHTAVRYLKKQVENPAWWFSIAFRRGSVFDSRHVGRLCGMIRKGIDDEMFVGLIERLFECNVVRIEFGKDELGKGLPQECGLCGVLINIYMSGFDRKVQRIQDRVNEGNPKDVGDVGDVVRYKPLKVYAIRYLNEILMITSGVREMIKDLLAWAIKYLEEKLELDVDRSRSYIHSATSEKMCFLGMEFRAVTPSELRRPLSEKEKRAKKQVLRQVEVKELELKNREDRIRKKLGLKIFIHVYKKLKKFGPFDIEYQIENEVSEIFRGWADEVVQEFLGSLEERMVWHRLLTGGDFLSLKKIRDQLPQELVDAYDKFQKEVNIHVSPAKLRKAMKEKQIALEQEEERQYNKRIIADMTTLCMKVRAPIELIRQAVRLAMFTNKMGRPRPISLLTALEDADIIKWYAGVGLRWLEYFACCHNFPLVATIVNYHLRYSCLLTLAEKHDATKNQTIRHYTKDLKMFDLLGNEEVYFPTEREMVRLRKAHFADPKPVDAALTLTLIRLAYDEPSYTCRAHFCDRNDTVTYRVWLLQHRLGVNPTDEQKWVPGMAAIHDSFHRKCLPLCGEHFSELSMGRLLLQDIDCTSFVDVD